ncbi:uncharacterized protein CTHT_0019330 [Thermochaetoides thermophila DSM 1495]|uniref:3'(2'),5'-bisphosphate nucleotidase n=1 Tax=Chaetomium thermophilum (strain DSM 1495 / CBS 144.50 / IMI 039719) TaxID=759272 RepID=G0S319_CHATD|nr:hypothetical protein CTHT_0019330 [Thermochaetoides thermophila DSM 1495]EGS22402.1 hypothetical protein CTHT_0019330 [Thermochaetoides thermophila DSM 1495]
MVLLDGQPSSSEYAAARNLAELAVERASLATKRVLATIPSLQDKIHPESPLSRYLKSQTPDRQCDGTWASLNKFLKDDKSVVTVADYAAQALLIAAIRASEKFKNDKIIAEESIERLRSDPEFRRRVFEVVESTKLDNWGEKALGGSSARPNNEEELLKLFEGLVPKRGPQTIRKGDRFWCMDPVDGTSRYLTGGQYAVMLALVDGEGEAVAAVGCPNLRLPASRRSFDIGDDDFVLDSNADLAGFGCLLSAERCQGARVRRMWPGTFEEKDLSRENLGSELLSRNLLPPPAADLSNVLFVDSPTSPASLSEKVKELCTRLNVSYPPEQNSGPYASHMRNVRAIFGGRNLVQVRWPKPGPKEIWDIHDHVGTQLIYRESGPGKVTDLRGKTFDFAKGQSRLTDNWGLVMADPSIHDTLIQKLEEMLNEEKEKKNPALRMFW